jgi:rare lipoprotein A
MLFQEDQINPPSHKMMDAASRMTDHALDHAASTVRIIISAEERLRQRIRSVLRVAVAMIFFGISGIISLGATVTTAFAKKVNPDRGNTHNGLRLRRAGTNVKAAYHRHSVKHHHRTHAMAAIRGGSSMRGVASWYGKEFHNRRTASGVRFDTHAMMAAHRSLPFGTKVRVTNLTNKKSCIVEITDRGPFSHGRIIDLSFAAAEKLDMMESGIANVQLEVLDAKQSGASEDIAFASRQPVEDGFSPLLVTQAASTQLDLHWLEVAPFVDEDAAH